MPDPVSWLLVRPGWRVLSSDGSEIGQVDAVVGDENEDIFDGLSIAVTRLGQPRYVDAEHVGRIEVGEIHLRLDHDATERLAQYREPATSLRIEPDDHHGVGESIAAEARDIEAKLIEPTQSSEHGLNPLRRLIHYLRRLRG